MDRHDATTAFIEDGLGPFEAEQLGKAVELLSSVPAAKFLVSIGTVAISDEGIADLSEPLPDDEDILDDVVDEVVEADDVSDHDPDFEPDDDDEE